MYIDVGTRTVVARKKKEEKKKQNVNSQVYYIYNIFEFHASQGLFLAALQLNCW